MTARKSLKGLASAIRGELNFWRLKLRSGHLSRPKPADPIAIYRANARPITAEVTAVEADLLRLTNAVIEDVSLADSRPWQADYEQALASLGELRVRWNSVDAPQEWQQYHKPHLDYVDLFFEAYELVYAGFIELDDAKLVEADSIFAAAQAKRAELQQLVAGLLSE